MKVYDHATKHPYIMAKTFLYVKEQYWIVRTKTIFLYCGENQNRQ